MVRAAVHVAVTQANLAGVPPNLSGSTQTLRDPDMPSDSGTAPVQATNTTQPTGQAEGQWGNGLGCRTKQRRLVNILTTVE